MQKPERLSGNSQFVACNMDVPSKTHQRLLVTESLKTIYKDNYIINVSTYRVPLLKNSDMVMFGGTV